MNEKKTVEELWYDRLNAACQGHDKDPINEAVAMTVRTVSGAEYFGDVDPVDMDDGFMVVVTKTQELPGGLWSALATVIIKLEHVESITVDGSRLTSAHG
jgi:hypothetical protein